MVAMRAESAVVAVVMFLALCWGQETANQTRKCERLFAAHSGTQRSRGTLRAETLYVSIPTLIGCPSRLAPNIVIPASASELQHAKNVQTA
jgi:hypothetical protein